MSDQGASSAGRAARPLWSAEAVPLRSGLVPGQSPAKVMLRALHPWRTCGSSR